MAAAKTVTFENRQRDRKFLGITDAEGKEFMLGSVDDLGKKDADGELLPQPMLTLEGDLARELIKRKAIQGWIDTRAITVT